MKEDVIVNGDAYELIKKIPDKNVDLIVTDPPYEIKGLHGGTGIFRNQSDNYVKELASRKLGGGIS